MDWTHLCEETVGHDSQLDGIHYDPVAAQLVLRLQSYLERDSSDRHPVTIIFMDVTSVVTHFDGSILADNRSAGNVNFWQMHEDVGTSTISLFGGYISITSAKSPEFQRG